MQTLPLLPETAPFAAEQIAALNRVISATNPEQRAWLSGFLAGYQAANDKGQAAPAAAPVAPPAPRAPLTILYATESGNSEALAAQAKKAAQRLGFAPKVVDMADATPEALARARNLLVIASTWGEGDPPQRAADFYTALMGDGAPKLDGLRFAVLALGDSAYVNFCETGRRLDARLEALGATRVAARVDCDLEYQSPAAEWIGGALAELERQERAAQGADGAVIHVDFLRPAAAAEADEAPARDAVFEAEIAELVNLNSSRSDKETYHVALSLGGASLPYEPGDSLAVLPVNDPALVEEVLSAVGLGGDTALHEALSTGHDITTLSRKLAESYAALTGDAGLSGLLRDEARLAEFLAGRQVIDLFEAFPHRLAPAQLTGLLRRLPPRLYSIASSRRAMEDEAHLLVGPVRYESAGRARKGVASTYLAERRRVGDTLRVQLRPNRHFRLPADPGAPVVMIGPGTGVAPFRAFLQERDALGSGGRNWLFFGDRRYTHDFLYQLEWQDLLKRGVLTQLDVAFSRDQRAKRYVQHAMWERRAELWSWLQDGAHLYVCGDANAMARDVHDTLRRIAADQGGRDAEGAEAYLATLRREGRYLQDVY